MVNALNSTPGYKIKFIEIQIEKSVYYPNPTKKLHIGLEYYINFMENINYIKETNDYSKIINFIEDNPFYSDDACIELKKVEESEEYILTKLRPQVQIKTMVKEDTEDFEEDSVKAMEDFEEGSVKAMEDFEEDSVKAIEDFEEDSVKAIEDFEEDSVKAIEDFEEDSVKAIEDYEEDFVKAMEDSVKAMEDYEEDSVKAMTMTMTMEC